eukprot:1244178-Karenia_brevis.AAC.1
MPSQCFLPACILWHDHQWWRWRQETFSTADPAQRAEQWRHARPGQHMKWEDVFVKTFGSDWKKRAASSAWKQCRGEFRDKAYQSL